MDLTKSNSTEEKFFMENKAGADQSLRTYEDFEPFCKWLAGREVVEVHVRGFRREHLRVRTNNVGMLIIDGERPVNETTWSRFHKELKLPDNCDQNEVRAKLVGYVLRVTMPPNPKLISKNNIVDQNHTSAAATATHDHINHHGQEKEKQQQQPQPASTTNHEDKDVAKPTSCEFRGKGSSTKTTFVTSRLKQGKDVALKILVAVAVVVAFGFGACVVKHYKYMDTK